MVRENFSIPKTELTPQQFETYLEGKEARAAITQNVEAALGADIIREHKGIFQFEELALD